MRGVRLCCRWQWAIRESRKTERRGVSRVVWARCLLWYAWGVESALRCWWHRARAQAGGAYHCELVVLGCSSFGCRLCYSFCSSCSGLVVCELSGESRFRSMVKGSSMELKPRCLSKRGVRVLAARSAADYVWGRCFSSPKSVEVEALLQPARWETLQHSNFDDQTKVLWELR
jgi:hypothetical protein